LALWPIMSPSNTTIASQRGNLWAVVGVQAQYADVNTSQSPGQSRYARISYSGTCARQFQFYVHVRGTSYMVSILEREPFMEKLGQCLAFMVSKAS